ATASVYTRSLHDALPIWQPQPVPPIFQPEVAAEAILYAARHHPRELWVGGPTLKAILGQRLAPSVLDAYLGRYGYEAQQTAEPVSRVRRDNLWAPLPGDHGAHGNFDDRALERSKEFWARTHLPWILGGIGALALMTLAGVKSIAQEAEDLAAGCQA